MENRQKKRQILSYVLYLTLVCVLVFGVTYARYRSNVTGKGTAAVAKVVLNSTADLDNRLEGMRPGEERKIDVEITNVLQDGTTSEVTQDYSVTVETTGNLPLEFTLEKKSADANGTYVDTTAIESTENTKIWTGGQMQHTTIETHGYVLTVKWKENETSAEYADEIDKITLTVDATQSKPDK